MSSILRTNIWGRGYFYSYFKEDETEAQRCKVTWPLSQSWNMVGLGFGPVKINSSQASLILIAPCIQHSCFFSDAGPVIVGRSTYFFFGKKSRIYIYINSSFLLCDSAQSIFLTGFCFLPGWSCSSFRHRIQKKQLIIIIMLTSCLQDPFPYNLLQETSMLQDRERIRLISREGSSVTESKL